MVDATEQDDEQELPSMSPDTVIAGKYRIEQMIGKGGMGSVWSAVHLGLNQRVAIKLISRRYANSKEARQRFDLEAKAAAQLRSRFVVQVYDNGETEDGTPYIVMELLEGESLDQRIQRLGPVPVEASLRILGQVARALGRAHSLGIVHRDLKPENIFLTHSQDDDGEIAKVLDFGIAKIKSDGTVSATRTGAVLGTPLFMSPEQARALRTVDHRTDIYSFGIVAYTMMTGQPAFTGESFGDILVAICTQPLPSMRSAAPWLPPGIDEWLTKSCAREAAQRYGTIEQTVDGLYAALGIARNAFASPEVPRAGSSGLDRRGSSASATPVWAAPQPVATLAASATSGSRGQGPGENHTTSALMVSGADIPKRSMLPAVIAIVAFVAVAGGGAFFLLRRAPTDRNAATTLVEPPPTATSSAEAVAHPAEEPSASATGESPHPKSDTTAAKASASPPIRPVPPPRPAPVSRPEPRPAVKPAPPPPPKPTATAKPRQDLGF